MATSMREVELFPEWARKQINDQLAVDGKQTSGQRFHNATEITLVLPIYWTIERKIKKSKTVLVGMNWFRNAHFILQNNMKKHISKLVKEQLAPCHGIRWEAVSVAYRLYPKRKNQDKNNIVTLIDKFLLDALQDFGLIENDTCQYYHHTESDYIELDKINPRIECVLTKAERKL